MLTANATCCLVILYRSQTRCLAYCLCLHAPQFSLLSGHISTVYPPHYTHFVSTHLLGQVYSQSFSSPYLNQISRNPEHHARPTFEDITMGLARDPVVLLSWNQQDRETSAKAAVLGAPLEEGKHLYPDLQNKY